VLSSVNPEKEREHYRMSDHRFTHENCLIAEKKRKKEEEEEEDKEVDDNEVRLVTKTSKGRFEAPHSLGTYSVSPNNIHRGFS
jgi:hypothetical protein